MLEKYGFRTMSAEDCWQKEGWGVALDPGSTVYVRDEGSVTTYVGAADGGHVCEVYNDGEMEGQWTGDTYIDALVNGFIDYFHRQAVHECRDEALLIGCTWCFEDVINWLAAKVPVAIRDGIRDVLSDKEGNFDEEWHVLSAKAYDGAIEMARLIASKNHGEVWDCEFEDVWDDLEDKGDGMRGKDEIERMLDDLNNRIAEFDAEVRDNVDHKEVRNNWRGRNFENAQNLARLADNLREQRDALLWVLGRKEEL
jgi:hypothetical protein